MTLAELELLNTDPAEATELKLPETFPSGVAELEPFKTGILAALFCVIGGLICLIVGLTSLISSILSNRWSNLSNCWSNQSNQWSNW